MKKILSIFILLSIAFTSNAQLPDTDSTRKFIDRYVRNSAVEAFQALRLNTILKSFCNFIDSAGTGGGGGGTSYLAGYGLKLTSTTFSVDTATFRKVDTVYATNDSTLVYKINNRTYTFTLKGAVTGQRLKDTADNIRASIPQQVNLIAGTNITITGTYPNLTVNSTASGGGSGTVTSVAVASGTSGSDVNISGSPITSSGTITINIPDASPTARGLITAATQQIGGSKIFTGTYTPSSKLAYSLLLNGTLTASANNDTLVGIDLNPSYSVSSFTGVRQIGIRNPILDNQIGHIRTFASTGNVSITSAAATAVDGGFKLDVNGTARVSGAFTASSSMQVGTTITATTLTVTGTMGITGGGTSITSTTADFLQSTNNTYLTRFWDRSSAGTLGELLRLFKSPAATVSNGTGTYVSAFNNNQPGGGNKTIGDFTFWQKNPTSTSVEGIFELSLPYQINTATSKITNTIFRANGIGVIIGSQTNHTGGSDANTKAVLELKSTTQGFLPPRMTATQASALSLSTTEEGLMIYVLDTNGTFTTKGWWGWNGSAWEKLNN